MAGNPEAICVGIDDFSEFGGPREEFGARFEAARSPRHSFHEMDYRDYLADLHEGPIGVYLYDGENSYEGEFEALTAAEPYFAESCVLMADDTNRSQRRQAMLDFAEQSAHDYSVVLDVRTGANRHPTFWNGTLVLRRGGVAQPTVIGHEPREHPAQPSISGSSVSVVLLADGDVAAATERIRAQTWSDTELVVAESASDLGDAIERTSGDIVAFADCAADLHPDAVEISLAYPDAVRFWHGRLEEARLDRLRAGTAAGRDLASVLEPGTPFFLVSDRLGLPDTLDAGPAAPLADAPLRDLDDDAAAGALRAAGAGHLVVLSSRFSWLDERPGAAAYLGQHATTLLSNEHARVFTLGGAA
jgi:hypothetical protein